MMVNRGIAKVRHETHLEAHLRAVTKSSLVT